MKKRVLSSAFVVVALAVSPAPAAPFVFLQITPEITVLPSGPVDAYDLFYQSTPGGEFLNYRLIVETTGGSHIRDPNRGPSVSGQHYDDVTLATGGGPRVDTWANTVYSSLGLGVPTLTQLTYDAIAPGQTALPTNKIDWIVFDNLSGDDNDISADVGDPGNPDYIAPYHLARILIDSPSNGCFQGYIEMTVFDSVTLEIDGITPIPTTFHYSSLCSEPSSGLIAFLALGPLLQFVRSGRKP